MTAQEQAEFIRISEENAEIKRAVVGIVGFVMTIKDELGLPDFNELKNFSMTDIPELMTSVIMTIQVEGFNFEKLQQFSYLLPIVDKYKYLVAEPNTTQKQIS